MKTHHRVNKERTKLVHELAKDGYGRGDCKRIADELGISKTQVSRAYQNGLKYPDTLK